MAWVLLVIAGLLEVGWSIGLKYTEGFTRWGPSVLTIAAIAASMVLLSLAARTLPIGTAYAVWVGIGALGAAVLGIVLFHEHRVEDHRRRGALKRGPWPSRLHRTPPPRARPAWASSARDSRASRSPGSSRRWASR
jgi:quaternary ammonium compound-resistance protein SugE